MIVIIFESHATSLDNESGVSSGWYDIGLSDLGRRQAKELGERREGEKIDVVFCSDLERSYKTAEIAFADRDIKIVKDKKLRECDYGDLTRHASKEVESLKEKHITEAFPNGESYKDAAERMRNFLEDLLKNYNGKKVIVIGHRATQYGLEHWIKKIPLEETVTAPWTWQPGWVYHLENLE